MTAKLVCVVGIDGAGKTTVATRVAKALAAEGVPVEYVWCRFESKALALALRAYNALFSRKRATRYATNTRRKRKLFSNRLAGGLYRRFVVFSYTRQIRRAIGKPLAKGRSVVCDRYVFDSVVDLALDLGLDDAATDALAARFLRKAPKPAVTAHLVLPPEVAMARKDDVPELSYLSERARIYERISAAQGFVRVDATQAPEAVFEETVAIARKTLGEAR